MLCGLISFCSSSPSIRQWKYMGMETVAASWYGDINILFPDLYARPRFQFSAKDSVSSHFCDSEYYTIHITDDSHHERTE